MTEDDRSRAAKKAWETRRGEGGGIVRKEGRPPRIQLFRASPQAGLVGMNNARFENEKRMQTLVERNIGALFPGLKFLKTEDRDMTEGKRRPDTIAFDTNLNTFVVMEYKNKQDRGVVMQAKAYLQDMRENKGDLTLAYREQSDHSPRDRNSFDWNRMYAIIIATEFDPYSIQGAGKDAEVEMYEIDMYDDRVVVMERVGGAHVRQMLPPDPPPPPPPPDTGIPLSKIDFQKEREPPTQVSWNGATHGGISSWIGLLVGVTELLVSGRGDIIRSRCPVMSGPKKAILNTSPTHPNGIIFNEKTQVGELFLNKNWDKKTIIKNACKLAEAADVDASDFKVLFPKRHPA